MKMRGNYYLLSGGEMEQEIYFPEYETAYSDLKVTS